ncbi:MBL fold metallo-hydrolase [Rhodanobacter sp. C01]|uniref:MBL fold metallo-hydrolase n=1 Tax=Rhodanobacter sp. C01 TaxID=1945856 RepID=UPI00098483D1|nr:MBL fold metallo-hydrolase [Rhodanobacter sp. C01]OOG50089.1 MBL fold metallo-hydrolase [Rhodanobacter sp. C01]
MSTEKIIYSCHGAAREVTGSCHLLRCGDRHVLIDCGLFQGGREQERANFEPFGFDPASIDVLLLTHAHLDHCGRIPKLIREGFHGRILATAATRDLARVVMLDAAGLQEEDARRAQRSGRRRDEAYSEPLYTLDDALHAMDYFADPVAYDMDVPVIDGVRARFQDAGHILGSASILVTIEQGAQPLRILFSGDLGNPGRPILRNPVPAPEANYVVMETTYGDRPHRALPDSVDELYRAIQQTLARGGNVIIPTFALERAQEVLYYLHRGIQGGQVPAHTPVFMDSPMAISATEIFRRHAECFDDDFRKELEQSDPFAMPNLHFCRDTAESMAINHIESGAIILAGSGMCTGGRVLHHLKNNLWRQRSSVVFVGYAANGSLARRIVDGAKSVRIFHEEINVNAQIWTINGFSAHADQSALLDWLGNTSRKRVLLVHGEYERGMRAMETCLEKLGFACQIPQAQEAVVLAESITELT